MNKEENNTSSEVITNEVSLQAEFIGLWKVSDFTDQVNILFKKKYKIESNVTLNTINNYFRQLETQGVHFLNRSNSTKVYDERDLKVAEFIIVKRTKSLNGGIAWQIPQIIDALDNSNMVRRKDESNVDDEGNRANQDSAFETMVALKTEIQKLIIELKEESKKNQLLLKDFKEKEKKIAANLTLDLLAKQREYRLEAIQLWERKDDKERFEGWLFKRERVGDRDRFIEDYIIDKLTKSVQESINNHDNENN